MVRDPIPTAKRNPGAPVPTADVIAVPPEEQVQREGRFWVLLSFIPSALVATCCLGPLLFILFGVSASHLSGLKILQPYKPYFLGGALLALGYAFYLLYLKKNPIDCACDLDPARIRAKRLNRILFWIATGFFVVTSLYPYVLSRIL